MGQRQRPVPRPQHPVPPDLALHSQVSQLPNDFSTRPAIWRSFTVGLLNNLVSAITCSSSPSSCCSRAPACSTGSTWVGVEQRAPRPPDRRRGLRRGPRLRHGQPRSRDRRRPVHLADARAARRRSRRTARDPRGDLRPRPADRPDVGGLLVAVVAAPALFPDSLLSGWSLFIVYQQLQDRVVQPIFYGARSGSSPLIAILVLLAGAQISGILGALLAIPVAASIAVDLQEFWPRSPDDQDAEGRTRA